MVTDEDGFLTLLAQAGRGPLNNLATSSSAVVGILLASQRSASTEAHALGALRLKA